jgi:hypothetical protein
MGVNLSPLSNLAAGPKKRAHYTVAAIGVTALVAANGSIVLVIPYFGQVTLGSFAGIAGLFSWGSCAWAVTYGLQAESDQLQADIAQAEADLRAAEATFISGLMGCGSCKYP